MSEELIRIAALILLAVAVSLFSKRIQSRFPSVGITVIKIPVPWSDKLIEVPDIALLLIFAAVLIILPDLFRWITENTRRILLILAGVAFIVAVVVIVKRYLEEQEGAAL